MKITDYIIDLKDSTLADRLKLRQVLLDNYQSLFSNILLDSNIPNRSYGLIRGDWCMTNEEPNISISYFITKFEKRSEIRNLAFYKHSGEPWTRDEYEDICKYCGSELQAVFYKPPKWIFDDGMKRYFMGVWCAQATHENFSNCVQVAYEDVFPSNFELVKPVVTNPSVEVPVGQPKQPTKENKMTIQQLLAQLFGAEKPTTDYDRRPAILVVAYNRDGSEMGTATAPSLKAVKQKVANTPELWGCKVLTYALDQEVSVEVPVKSTKATTAADD